MFEKLQTGKKKIHDAPRQPKRCMLPIVSAMAKIYFSKTKDKLKERVQFELQEIPEVTFFYKDLTTHWT